MLCCTQVLVVFKAAPELCNLLRAVEEEYTKAREQHKSRVEGPHADVVPWIQAQAAAFESAATASVRECHMPHLVGLVQHLFLTEPSSTSHHSIATPGLTNGFAKLACDRAYGRQHSLAAMSTPLVTAHTVPGSVTNGFNRFHFRYQTRCSLHHLRQANKCQLVMPITFAAGVIIQCMYRSMTVGCACRRRRSLCCSAGVGREVQLRCATSSTRQLGLKKMSSDRSDTCLLISSPCTHLAISQNSCMIAVQGLWCVESADMLNSSSGCASCSKVTCSNT